MSAPTKDELLEQHANELGMSKRELQRFCKDVLAAEGFEVSRPKIATKTFTRKQIQHMIANYSTVDAATRLWEVGAEEATMAADQIEEIKKDFGRYAENVMDELSAPARGGH